MAQNPVTLSKSAERVLAELAGQNHQAKNIRSSSPTERDIRDLLARDLVTTRPNGHIAITGAGISYLARMAHARTVRADGDSSIDPFRAQHLSLARQTIGPRESPVTVDEAESPLAWLARRKARDGQLHIAPVQLQAGERLRAEFTRAQLMPRTTSNWSATIVDGRGHAGPHAHITETVVAARQRVRQALDSVGPEFSGLLLDVCCFLKGLTDVERERGWPSRSAKVVLQLGLDRLARHYGLAAEARGLSRVPSRTWSAQEETSETAIQ